MLQVYSRHFRYQSHNRSLHFISLPTKKCHTINLYDIKRQINQILSLKLLQPAIVNIGMYAYERFLF